MGTSKIRRGTDEFDAQASNRLLEHGGMSIMGLYASSERRDFIHAAGTMPEIDKVHCGDSLEVIKGMPSNAFQLVFYDPPYNKKKNYGVFKDNLEPPKYRRFHSDLLYEAHRVSRNGVTIFLCQELVRLFWDMMPEAKLIIIKKRAAGLKFGSSRISMQWHGLLTTSWAVDQPKGQSITDLWENIRLPGEGYLYKHLRTSNPGETSLSLTREVIRAFTNPKDLVLDPFMGCGTTAIACKQMDRHYVGIEVNPDYIVEGEERLQRMTAQGEMVLKYSNIGMEDETDNGQCK